MRISDWSSDVCSSDLLTSHFQYADLPLFGRIPLASAVLFDLGVFCLVVGATTLMLIALPHQSLRRPRGATIVTAEGPTETQAAGSGSWCCRSPAGSLPRQDRTRVVHGKSVFVS